MSLRPSTGVVQALRESQRIESWGHPLKAIARDYVEVIKDLFLEAKRRPLKTLLYTVSVGGAYVTCRKRPDLEQYLNDVVEYSNDLGMCGVAKSNRAQRYIDQAIRYHSNGYLLYLNFGLCSVILRRHGNLECCSYEQRCAYLRPRVWELGGGRVVDVGVWGRWLVLQREMVDFDVNELEL